MILRALASLSLMVLASPLLHGGEPAATEPGFARLDNGSDLVDWLGNKGNWSVRDGAIHLDAQLPGGSIFHSKTHSRNCIIRLQYRASFAADSGVFLHGGQFQVRDYPNSLPDTMPFAPYARPAGQWNDLEFDVTDGVAVVTLNGHVIARSWAIGDKPNRGVGLQKETGDFDYRNIRLKEKQGG